MGVTKIGGSVDIAISGLRAEATRMRLTAENIANAQTSRTPDGTPYRRKELVLSAGGPGGAVQIEGVTQDMSTDFKSVYMPGHPDAGDNGMVQMPNVDLPVEMINLITASRAYQANAAILKRFQGMVDATLELLR